MRVEDLTPTPEIVQLVARTVRGSAIDPGLVLAVIAAESAFDRQAVSRKNAVGLMQLMPETAARFGVRHPFDAEENVRAGASYLQLLLQKYRDLKLALAAYNAGEGPVLSYGAVPPYQETTEYVARVLRLYERYKNIAFDRGEPANAVAAATVRPAAAPTRAKNIEVAGAAAPAKAKDSRSCSLICRGNMLAARLDDAAGRMPASPRQPDAAGSGSLASARAN
ncbi:MAG TPA: lytic transglycosylase domain-containing protein [Stellaceae bacterium]|nr:lytic transglycosylase domain-containing protein [Stellaceae bacterium]